MGFDPMPRDEIQAYVGVIGNSAQAVSVILTDGTILTGRYYIRDDPSHPLALETHEGNTHYDVAIPADRIAGILEQFTSEPRGQGWDPSILLPSAERAGLQVSISYSLSSIDPGGQWIQSERIRYLEDTMLYFDADAISARSGGINSIGLGFALASASAGWQYKLIDKAKGFLKHHVIDVGSHCAAPRADMTLKGYVQFFDVCNC